MKFPMSKNVCNPECTEKKGYCNLRDRKNKNINSENFKYGKSWIDVLQALNDHKY